MKSLALLAALAAVLVISAWHDLGAPLGPSHDGRNGGEWALASDGVEAHGLIGSRLGAVHADGTVYANHPPLTGLVTAGSVTLLGRSETAVRLPALLAALATIPLLWLVLRRLRLPPEAAAAGCAITLTTPMFIGFGPMVDTPPMSFPIGLALLAAWLSPARRERLLAVLAATAVLAGWQAGFLVALVAGADVARAWRDHRRPGWGLPAGSSAGALLLGAWLLWVHGGIGPVVDVFRYRTGNGPLPISLPDSVHAQATMLWAELGVIPLIIGAAGCVMAMRRQDARALTAIAVAVVAVYGLVLREAAFWHSYWNYWALLPAGIGLATLAARLIDVPSERELIRTTARAGVVAIVLVAIAAAAFTVPPVKRQTRDAYAVAAPLQHARLPASQRRVWLIGHVEAPASWIEFYGRRPVTDLRTVAALQRVRRTRPDDLVFIVPGCVDEAVCRAVGGTGYADHSRLVPAGEIDVRDARG